MNRTNKAINSQYAVSQFLPFGEVRRGCYYDAHGNMLTMPHLTSMGWDYLDQLHSAGNGTFTSYYNYDAEGKRTRKIVVKGNIREERYYIGDYEVYRKYINNVIDTERTTVNISDDEKRFAIIDTLTVENGEELDPYQVTIRYQYDNHLGSACLELDDTGQIISYEEYHSFGTTSYRSGRSQTEVSLKRYKYCGKERDEETGLYYYGMRYYAAWICRFVSVDPLQFKYPHYTPYQYAGNKPITYIDLDGGEEKRNFTIKGVHFIELENVNFSFTFRKENGRLTDAMKARDTEQKDEYSINLQLFDPDLTSQGLNIKNKKIVEGRSSKNTFYIAINDKNQLTAGQGDPPLNSKIAWGGAIPMYVNGIKYGKDNIFKPDTPNTVKQNKTGPVDQENYQYLLQKSNKGYVKQNNTNGGKTILAYNSSKKTWMIVSQSYNAKDKYEGMNLDDIRDYLIGEGYDIIMSYDGKDSATLVNNLKVISAPSDNHYDNNGQNIIGKNSLIEIGLTLQVPLKNN